VCMSICLLQPAYGVAPGTMLSFKSTSESVHITLAYSAVNAVIDSFLEWRVGLSGRPGFASAPASCFWPSSSPWGSVHPHSPVRLCLQNSPCRNQVHHIACMPLPGSSLQLPNRASVASFISTDPSS
jgi:hypothetical protein